MIAVEVAAHRLGCDAARPPPLITAEDVRKVKAVARSRAAKCHGAVDADELAAEALLALVHCVRRFRPGPGMNFFCYAWPRINGAMIDAIRRAPLFRAVPAAAGNRARPARRVFSPLDESMDAFVSPSASPLDELERREQHELLQQEVRALPQRLQRVLRLRCDGKTLQEIGRQLSVTEARACQMLRDVRNRLHAALEAP